MGWTRFRLGWRRIWGRLANVVGLPGFVRVGKYTSGLGVTVRVRTTPLFTIVTVQDTDVYFYRLTGRIDGVGRPIA
jgi:hypothetical protein